jgi:hypothetical protein
MAMHVLQLFGEFIYPGPVCLVDHSGEVGSTFPVVGNSKLLHCSVVVFVMCSVPHQSAYVRPSSCGASVGSATCSTCTCQPMFEIGWKLIFFSYRKELSFRKILNRKKRQRLFHRLNYLLPSINFRDTPNFRLHVLVAFFANPLHQTHSFLPTTLLP